VRNRDKRQSFKTIMNFCHPFTLVPLEHSLTPSISPPKDNKLQAATDNQETIQIVQRGIERLATIDSDRLVFKMLSGTGDGQHWAKVLDEAWERFDANPPARLAIAVADLPGDGDLRTSPASVSLGSGQKKS